MHVPRAVLSAALAAAAMLAAPAIASAQLQAVTPTPPVQIVAGLSGVQLGGMAVARDGSGGVVYTATTGGIEHVYVARFVGGAFGAPQQLDTGLPDGSSDPVIAADNGGELIVAFINGGNLYAAQTASATQAFTTEELAGDASSPSVALDTYGVGYLAFTAATGSGDDVDVDYWNGTGWAPASPAAMNVTDGDDAGTGAGAPSVAAAGDGIGIVAWGENGHVYSRRVWGTATSVETEQLDPASVGGWTETSADSPQVAVGGNSSYVDVAFRAHLTSGAETQDRALVTRLVAEDTGTAVPVDGLSTPGTTSATAPQIAMNEYGRGFVTTTRDPGDGVFATALGTNGAAGGIAQVDGGLGTAEPFAVPGLAGLISTEIAWQQTTAAAGSAVLVRYAADGTDLAPPLTLSNPALGPTDAADGLQAGGDSNGDAIVAWVQGAGDAMSVDAALLYKAPGQATPNVAATAGTRAPYTTRTRPTLQWGAAPEAWGPISYEVMLDGTQIATTTATRLTVPVPLTDGGHQWSIVAVNAAGLTSTSSVATVFVDTYRPQVRLALTGRLRARRRVTLRLSERDLANPTEAGAVAAGIAATTIRWGDRATTVATGAPRSANHVYARAGVYRLTVTAVDAAGNATTVAHYLRVAP